MSTDVLPEPVGPMMRLIAPSLNFTSSSILRRNVCRDGVGVPPAFSSVHEKFARPMPISALCAADTSVITSSSADVSVKASRSSV